MQSLSTLHLARPPGIWTITAWGASSPRICRSLQLTPLDGSVVPFRQRIAHSPAVTLHTGPALPYTPEVLGLCAVAFLERGMYHIRTPINECLRNLISPAKMANDFPMQGRVFTCRLCGNHLASNLELISKASENPLVWLLPCGIKHTSHLTSHAHTCKCLHTGPCDT